MEDIKQIRSRLWNSLEMQVVIKNLVVVLILTVFCILLGLQKLRYLDAATRIGGTVLITAICTLPMLIFCLVRTFRIFWKPQGYHFCKTTLSKPKGGNIRHTIRFTVLLEDSDGHKLLADSSDHCLKIMLTRPSPWPTMRKRACWWSSDKRREKPWQNWK